MKISLAGAKEVTSREREHLAEHSALKFNARA
jgi:hypothetical protein